MNASRPGSTSTESSVIGSSIVGVGSVLKNGKTSFFVAVRTSKIFLRLLCVTAQQSLRFEFCDQRQNPARGRAFHRLLTVQVPLHVNFPSR